MARMIRFGDELTRGTDSLPGLIQAPLEYLDCFGTNARTRLTPAVYHESTVKTVLIIDCGIAETRKVGYRPGG